MSRSNEYKRVAEHFTFFLAINGYLTDEYTINKKDLISLFKSQYLVIYHVYLQPWDLLTLLLWKRCIVRKRQARSADLNVVKFKANKVQEILSRYGYNTEADVLYKSLGTPSIKVYIPQKYAFPNDITKSPGFTETECKLCDETFQSTSDYESHKELETHKIRETYRHDRRQLTSNQQITVHLGSETENETDEMILRENSAGSVSIHIFNSSNKQYHLMNIFVLHELKELTMELPSFPVQLNQGGSITIPLSFKFLDIGAHIYPLILKFSTSSDNIFYVLKELTLCIQSEILDDLKPSAPYKNPSERVQKHNEAPLVYGLSLAPIPNSLRNERKLEYYNLSASLRRIINHGFKPFQTMTQEDAQKLNEVRSLLELDSDIAVPQLLNREKYAKLFSLLCYLEEHQMEIDIHMYDSDNNTLDEDKLDMRLLKLKVPGLSENRPSVLRGDRVYATIQGSNSVKYEGIVHQVGETEVWLGFDSVLRNKYLPNMKFHIQYTMNRLPLRAQQRALEMIEDHGVTYILFPTMHSRNIKETSLKPWFNRGLRNNPEQQQAVRNIVRGTAYPAPYLVFGPPGTGKTVTIVEAITQLYHLNQDGHLLVCAPSNYAADEIARRLLNTSQGSVPPKDILRLYASSRRPISIPEVLQKCCNYKDEFFYPPKTDIMNSRIVIVTLTTAGRLVTGGIPAGHFSHLFIDESGQAVEPEAIIPLAGLFANHEEKGKLFGQVVLAGDPKQLGPILRSEIAKHYGLRISLLERLMLYCDLYQKNELQNYNPLVLTKLVQNFRSHEKILTLPNKMFYDGELQACGDDQKTHLACSWNELPTKDFPLIFHNVKGKDQREKNSPSYFNPQEIEIILRYMDKLLNDRFKGYKLSPRDIGIITPYRKQAEKIREAFKKKGWERYSIRSVEQFQGQERSVIIISTVRSTWELVQDDYKFHLGFLKNPKRFNVAVTRAKALLIVVGNADILQRDPHWRELIHFCMAHKSCLGHKFKLTDVPVEVENLALGFSALELNSTANESGDAPQWRGDI